ASKTRIENIALWAPSAADDTYKIKIPGTAGIGQLLVDVVKIVATVTGATSVPIVIPLTTTDQRTSLDQTAGGGDLFRTTSTLFTSAFDQGCHWKYNASEWATIASVRFGVVFTSAVTGATYGEVSLWDVTAGAPVTGISVTNPTDPFETPTYKDVDF